MYRRESRYSFRVTSYCGVLLKLASYLRDVQKWSVYWKHMKVSHDAWKHLAKPTAKWRNWQSFDMTLGVHVYYCLTVPFRVLVLDSVPWISPHLITGLNKSTCTICVYGLNSTVVRISCTSITVKRNIFMRRKFSLISREAPVSQNYNALIHRITDVYLNDNQLLPSKIFSGKTKDLRKSRFTVNFPAKTGRHNSQCVASNIWLSSVIDLWKLRQRTCTFHEIRYSRWKQNALQWFLMIGTSAL